VWGDEAWADGGVSESVGQGSDEVWGHEAWADELGSEEAGPAPTGRARDEAWSDEAWRDLEGLELAGPGAASGSDEVWPDEAWGDEAWGEEEWPAQTGQALDEVWPDDVWGDDQASVLAEPRAASWLDEPCSDEFWSDESWGDKKRLAGKAGLSTARPPETAGEQPPTSGQHVAAPLTPVAKKVPRSALRAERRAAAAAAQTTAQAAKSAAVAMGGHTAATVAGGKAAAGAAAGAAVGPAGGLVTTSRPTTTGGRAEPTAKTARTHETAMGATGAGRTKATLLRRPGEWLRSLRGRRHLYFADVITTATLGPRSRPVRAVLSAVGIGIGITALVAVIGVPASIQAQKKADYDAWGANVLQVQPNSNQQTGEVTPIPDTAPAMIARISVVKAVLTVRATPKDTYAYRNDKVPSGETGGLTVWVADGDPVGALNATFSQGAWFSDATAEMPTAVLGRTAADRLGVGVGQSIWAGQTWWAVIGVMDNLPRYSSIYDSGVFLAPGYSARVFDDLPISVIQVNAYSGQAVAARSVMAATVNPARPSGVNVSNPSDYSYAQAAEMTTFGQLALGLGAVALIVGGIGIANTMVVAVMERRGEIGLRRALGARTGQIGLQFVLEAAVIGLFGGLIGVGLGAYAVFCYTAYRGMTFSIPLWVVLVGPAMAAAVGILAGLYPSLKAARQPPTTALRTV